MLKKAQLLISGRVQGVFYRVSAKEKADELRLSGYVKNLSDGRVEILVEGEEESIKEFADWCYIGSRLAEVKNVMIKWGDVKERRFSCFEIVRIGER